MSITYTLILLGTNIFQQVAPAGTRSRVLLDASTNLHNLLHGRFDTLITSITFIDYLPWEVLVMLPCMLIPVEIRLGSRRLAATYLLGNVGATTVVAIELYVGFRAGWLHNAATMTTEDVGVSYGAMATVGLLTVLFAPVLRKWWAAGWLVFAAVQMLGRREYFTIGHVLALLIGLGVSYLTVRTYHKDGTEYPAFSRTGQALFFVPTTVLGICLLI